MKKRTLILPLVLVVAFILGIVAYINSDSYKIRKSTRAMLEGDYKTALLEIQEINTSQTTSIKQYLNILEKRDQLVENFDKEKLTDTGVFVDEFVSAVESFSETTISYYLPQKLTDQCEYYKKISTQIQDYTRFLWTTYDDVQAVLENEIIRNCHDQYTYNELKNNVDKSQEALDKLRNYLSSREYEVNCYDCGEYVNRFQKVNTQIYDAVESSIEVENMIIEAHLEDDSDMNALYHYKNPNKNYKKEISWFLVPISESGGSYENAKRMTYTLKHAMFAYYINQYDS